MGADIRAYRWVISQLRAGKPVVLFPEGTRSRNGMMKAKPGIAQIALQSQASILPVGIVGTHRLGTWLRVLNPTGKITVNIGQVFSVPMIEGRPSRGTPGLNLGYDYAARGDAAPGRNSVAYMAAALA